MNEEATRGAASVSKDASVATLRNQFAVAKELLSKWSALFHLHEFQAVEIVLRDAAKGALVTFV